MDLVKIHSDPLRFLLDVLTLQSKNQLRIAKLGAASTREIAALWNDYNNKKIPESVMESLHQLDEGRKVAGYIVWKDDMDLDNPEIQIIGLGVYTLKTLRGDISNKLEDLAKRVDHNWDWVWKQITDPKAILHNLVNALQDVEEDLKRPQTKRKITMMKRSR